MLNIKGNLEVILMDKITDNEFKSETLSRLSALEVKAERIPPIETKISDMQKDITSVKESQAKILGILEGKESSISRARANIALWLAILIALFGEAGSKILSFFRSLI